VTFLLPLTRDVSSTPGTSTSTSTSTHGASTSTSTSTPGTSTTLFVPYSLNTYQ